MKIPYFKNLNVEISFIGTVAISPAKGLGHLLSMSKKI
jgi:hypothetical protein